MLHDNMTCDRSGMRSRASHSDQQTSSGIATFTFAVRK